MAAATASCALVAAAAAHCGRCARFKAAPWTSASWKQQQQQQGRRFQSQQRRQQPALRCSSREEVVDELESNSYDDDALEVELQEAVKSENYARAAKLRDTLKRRQEDCIAGVLAANARFYKAFEEGDVAGMRRVWSKGDNVHCVHPGASCISGHELVMSSWELMLLGPELVLPLSIHLQELEVRVKGSMGFITCIEVVKTPGVTNWGKQIATNVFEKQEDGVWRICMHHASYVGGPGK